jgi:hypothetical protein
MAAYQQGFDFPKYPAVARSQDKEWLFGTGEHDYVLIKTQI